MIRLTKKTRLRLTLLVAIPIISIIVILYSGLYYTSDQSKLLSFTSINNNDNINIDENAVTSDDESSHLLVVSKDEKKSSDNSLLKFLWAETAADNHLRCDAVNVTKPIDISVVDIYPTLEFKPKYKTFWNFLFENRYLERKENWRQLPLKIYILPHSHNDPGWLKTFEQYYFGYTAYILNNMLDKLKQYKDMTFIWAEMSFMHRWWDSLKTRPNLREQLRQHIRNGQLEIVTGGWVMTDEAGAHYYDMIDQLIEGHQFLRTEVGMTETPVTGWSIDPFGHSSTLPYLLQKSGIRNTIIQRTHFAWKQYLAEKQQLQFIWKQLFEVSDKSVSDLFCHMAPFDLYSFKYTCGPSPDICLQFDFRKIAGESSESTATMINADNVAEKAELVLGQYGRLASVFPHNIALIPLGDDFRYNFEVEWDQQYKNYQLLFQHINSNKAKYNNTEIKFGTLNDYFFDVHNTMSRLNVSQYPTLVGDFMPYGDMYADGKPSYWTGYYTTRPYWKALSRELQHWLRSAEILYSFARNIIRQSGNMRMSERLDKDYSLLTTARHNLALFMHHDAITGTSKVPVMRDYGERLNRGILESLGVISHCTQFLLLKDRSVKPADYNAAHPLTAYLFPDIRRNSWEELTQKMSVTIPPVDGRKIVVFNSMTEVRNETIRVHVKNPFIRVVNAENRDELSSEINPLFNSSSSISTSVFELTFVASLPPLSLVTYIIEIIDKKRRKMPEMSRVSLFLGDASLSEIEPDSGSGSAHRKLFNFENPSNLDFELSTPYLTATFDRNTGFLRSLHNKKLGLTREARVSFAAYKSADFYSGAYLFQPSQFDPMQNMTERFPLMRLIRGNISSRLTVIYAGFIEVTFIVYHSLAPIGSGLEVHCKFDISQRADLVDWEMIMRVQTDIDNVVDSKRVFYVDSNGFQMLKRVYNSELGVEANYYPMTTAMYIEDSNSRVTLLSSHAHGVTSHLNGGLEVMLDRKIRYDDNRGLSEGVLDNKLTLSKFWLNLEALNGGSVETVPNLSLLSHSLLSSLMYPPVILVTDGIQDRPLHSSVSFIDGALDSDHFLVNLRTLPMPSNFSVPSQSCLLLVHRRQSSCRVAQHLTVDTLSKPNASTAKASKFLGVKVQSMNECSLTGIKSYKRVVTDFSGLNVPPMQISGYNVTFFQ